jgi:hypothetical protein
MRKDAPFIRRRPRIVQKTLGAHWTRPAHISWACTVVSSLIRDDVHLASVRRREATFFVASRTSTYPMGKAPVSAGSGRVGENDYASASRHCRLRRHGPLTTRGRPQAWRSLFFAPCTSLRPCLRNGAPWRAVVGWVRMTAVLSILQDRILWWRRTCGVSSFRGTDIVFLQPARSIPTIVS